MKTAGDDPSTLGASVLISVVGRLHRLTHALAAEFERGSGSSIGHERQQSERCRPGPSPYLHLAHLRPGLNRGPSRTWSHFFAVAYFVLRYITRNASSGGVVPVQPPVDDSSAGTDTAAYDPANQFAAVHDLKVIFNSLVACATTIRPTSKATIPAFTHSSPEGFAIFGSSVDGWNAAQSYVQRNASQHPDWTFQNFFAKVLGSLSGTPVNNDQGNSNAEAKFVADYSGVDPSTDVSSYLRSDS